MASPEFDVCIIGYGPVGASLANLLGQSGLRVIVLERDGTVHHLPRAVSLDGEGMRLVQTMGLADELLPRLNVSRNIRHVSADGRLLLLIARGGIGPEGWHNAYRFYQPEFEALLRKGVQRFANVDVRLRREVFALDVLEDGVRVRYENLCIGCAERDQRALRRRLRRGALDRAALHGCFAPRPAFARALDCGRHDAGCSRRAACRKRPTKAAA